MPGVYRPYTLVDVLGTINQQSTATDIETITGLGYFAETDDGISTGDTVTTVKQTNAVWDAGQWGSFTWA